MKWRNLPVQFATNIGKGPQVYVMYFVQILSQHIHPQNQRIEHSEHSQHQRHCVRPHRFPCHHNSRQNVANRAEN